MRIAYLLSWELGKQDGVTKKVLAQSDEWIKQGHEVTIFYVCKDATTPLNASAHIIPFQRETASSILQEFFAIKKAYQKVKTAIIAYNPDIIYHRAEIPQPALTDIIKQFPTVIEINTNDLSEFKQIARKNLKGKIRFIYYSLIRDSYLGKVNAFCCVTNEIGNLSSIKKYNKPVAVVPNTLNLENYRLPQKASNNPIPRLLFMGSPGQAWHGTDKIIELASKTEGKLLIEVVGPEKPKGPMPSNVHFHGYLKQAEYEKIVQTCDIGICTLALHRNNMDEASPLKTREYLAYGLPIIVGYKDTAFYHKKPEWVLQLPNTEDNIESNVHFIVDFCKAFKGTKLTENQVKEYIDASVFEQKRLTFFTSLLNKKQQ